MRPDTLFYIYKRGLLRCRPAIDGQCEKPLFVGRQQIQSPTLFSYPPINANERTTEAFFNIAMGLFRKVNSNDSGQSDSSRNVMEHIQSAHDTETLIYLDSTENFNTSSCITVPPSKQAIFVKNGELYGILPSGRHQVQTENYPFLSRLRNAMSGGVSTFTCSVYHVSLNEQNVHWGTPSPIEIQDFYLGGGIIGVPTLVRGSGEFRVRFNINEDDEAAKQTFMRLMGDKSIYTVNDLSMLFRAQISQKIASTIGKQLQARSKKESINAISSELEDFSMTLTPIFKELFRGYGLDLVDFSFYNLSIDETDERKKYLDRLIGAAHTSNAGYNTAVQQEILKDMANAPGGMAETGAGIGMGMAAMGAFAGMSQNMFQQSAPQTAAQPQQDPMAVLSKLKQMLDAGLISQEKYDAKVDEIMSRL